MLPPHPCSIRASPSRLRRLRAAKRPPSRVEHVDVAVAEDRLAAPVEPGHFESRLFGARFSSE